MTYSTLLYEKKDGIGIVTLNRPDKMNALNSTVYKELYNVFASIEDDPEVRVVVLTGAGDKAFAAGSDVAEMQNMGPQEIQKFMAAIRKASDCIYGLTKPTIAAINGFAVGTGLELAMACTIRIASENARFGQSEINLGIMPGNGGTQRLPKLVGEGCAMEMILTGDLIDAQEAYRVGLVNRVVPQAELMHQVKELAAKLAAKSPLAIKLAKNAIHTGLNMSLGEGIEYENKLFAILCGSQDKQEGVDAFLEKRRPDFQAR